MYLLSINFISIYLLLLWIAVKECYAVSSSWPSSSSNWFGEGATGLLGRSWVDLIWDKDYLTSKINVRLVKKSWKPKGLAFDNFTDEFPGKVDEAYKILRENSEYEYISRPLEMAAELFTVKKGSQSQFDPKLESIILVHPVFSNGDEGYFTVPTVIALAMRNIHRKYNIFVYHMPILNINMIFTILLEAKGLKTEYEPMAEVLSSFIVDGILHGHLAPKKIHLIGYSYSGNLVGYMARYISDIFNNKVFSIICLDPYSAQYNPNLIHVNKDDAEVVHILHTCSYVEGTRERIATADFVYNDGFIQPECIGAKTIFNKILSFSVSTEPTVCSHIRVVPRFWYVILFPSLFEARRCDTWQRFRNCLCEDKERAFISYPIENKNIPFKGTYFLKTTGTKPYGMGDDGAHCDPQVKEKLNTKREEIVKKIRGTS